MHHCGEQRSGLVRVKRSHLGPPFDVGPYPSEATTTSCQPSYHAFTYRVGESQPTFRLPAPRLARSSDAASTSAHPRGIVAGVIKQQVTPRRHGKVSCRPVESSARPSRRSRQQHSERPTVYGLCVMPRHDLYSEVFGLRLYRSSLYIHILRIIGYLYLS